MNSTLAYEAVTERMIAALEAGTVPWRQPWRGRPAVSIRGHEYRGINALTLAFAPYGNPVWVTYNQARELGGNVRKGEKGSKVLLWKDRRREADDGEDRPSFFATTYTVFNLEQCDGVEPPARLAVKAVSPIAAAEAIVEGYRNRPTIRTNTQGAGGASYSPSSDVVNIPAPGLFVSTEHFYSTLFHELTHSTGHASRLDRSDTLGKVGDPYSVEELIAEFGAAFLSAAAGIDRPAIIEESAAYARFWLARLRDDRRILVQAASAAQKAADLIRGVSFAKRETKAA